MKKISCFALNCIIFVIITFSSAVNARIIYKDIPNISIKTDFHFDYEIISEDEVEDISYGSVSATASNIKELYDVYVYDDKNYKIESAEWYNDNSDAFDIGGEPKVVVYLNTKEYEYNRQSDNDYYYRFLSSYNSSNCTISNGIFVSATRLSTDTLKVVFKVKPIKGTYYAPTSAYWLDSSGNAVWEPDNYMNSGYFDVSLYRNNSLIHKLEKYRGTSYNFSYYMTKEGDYMFKVRTVPGTNKQMVSGKSSEYVESNVVTLQEDEISVNWQSGGGMHAGWVMQNGKWYFYLPNGNAVKSNWKEYEGKWYYLNHLGEMVTGIQVIDNQQYYFLENGAMITGWLKNGTNYNYYDNTPGAHLGAMCKNAWVLFQGKYFYFDNSGVMSVGWREIKDNVGNSAYYYFYPEGTTEGLFGYMAVNTNINGFYIGADGKWIGH